MSQALRWPLLLAMVVGGVMLLAWPGSAAAGSWAHVNSNGTAAKSRNIVSTHRFSTGGYGVIFKKQLTKCAVVATLQSSTAAIIHVVEPGPPPGTVHITTYDLAGDLVDAPFYIALVC
jgi:hypothetical protein